MPANMMPPQGGPPPAAPQGGPPGTTPGKGGGDSGDLMAALGGVKQALESILEGMQGAGAPPEALKLLETASSSFNQFVEMIAGGGKAAPPPGRGAPMDAMSAGNANARPVG